MVEHGRDLGLGEAAEVVEAGFKVDGKTQALNNAIREASGKAKK